MKHHALRWTACFFHKLSDDCSDTVRILPGKLQMKALIMMFIEIKRAVDFEFLVMRASLEVELWLLLYIVWIVTMGSSSRASLNGVSSAIPNAFHSYDLWLFTAGKECDFFFFFFKEKANRIFKKVGRQKQINIFIWIIIITSGHLNI